MMSTNSALLDPEMDSADTPLEPLSAAATVDLLARMKRGDRAALELLLARCLPPLRRWAHGQLPPFARSMQDTGDVVQDAVIKALRHLDGFEARHQGALLAYLRTSVKHRIYDLVDAHNRRPVRADLPDHLADVQPSPLDELLGRENRDRYEAALERLEPADREAIVARLEMGCTYDDLATILNKPSPAAARMAVTRAMKRLAEEIRRGA